MSGMTLRAVIAVVLLFHGVGHFMGVIPAFRLLGAGGGLGPEWLKGWSSRSWLLTGLIGDGAARALSVVLFLAAMIGFIIAGLALLNWLFPHAWWWTAAVVSAVISLAAIVLYWNAFIYLFPHKVGAIAVDIAVLICLLGACWPSEADIGF